MSSPDSDPASSARKSFTNDKKLVITPDKNITQNQGLRPSIAGNTTPSRSTFSQHKVLPGGNTRTTSSHNRSKKQTAGPGHLVHGTKIDVSSGTTAVGNDSTKSTLPKSGKKGKRNPTKAATPSTSTPPADLKNGTVVMKNLPLADTASTKFPSLNAEEDQEIRHASSGSGNNFWNKNKSPEKLFPKKNVSPESFNAAGNTSTDLTLSNAGIDIANGVSKVKNVPPTDSASTKLPPFATGKGRTIHPAFGSGNNARNNKFTKKLFPKMNYPPTAAADDVKNTSANPNPVYTGKAIIDVVKTGVSKIKDVTDTMVGDATLLTYALFNVEKATDTIVKVIDVGDDAKSNLPATNTATSTAAEAPKATASSGSESTTTTSPGDSISVNTAQKSHCLPNQIPHKNNNNPIFQQRQQQQREQDHKFFLQEAQQDHHQQFQLQHGPHSTIAGVGNTVTESATTPVNAGTDMVNIIDAGVSKTRTVTDTAAAKLPTHAPIDAEKAIDTIINVINTGDDAKPNPPPSVTSIAANAVTVTTTTLADRDANTSTPPASAPANLVQKNKQPLVKKPSYNNNIQQQQREKEREHFLQKAQQDSHQQPQLRFRKLPHPNNNPQDHQLQSQQQFRKPPPHPDQPNQPNQPLNSLNLQFRQPPGQNHELQNPRQQHHQRNAHNGHYLQKHQHHQQNVTQFKQFSHHPNSIPSNVVHNQHQQWVGQPQVFYPHSPPPFIFPPAKSTCAPKVPMIPGYSSDKLYDFIPLSPKPDGPPSKLLDEVAQGIEKLMSERELFDLWEEGEEVYRPEGWEGLGVEYEDGEGMVEEEGYGEKDMMEVKENKVNNKMDGGEGGKNKIKINKTWAEEMDDEAEAIAKGKSAYIHSGGGRGGMGGMVDGCAGCKGY